MSETRKTIETKEEAESEDRILTCPECGSTRIRETSAAELVCQECGTVLEDEMIETSSSRRAFSAEERERVERTGRPITYTEPSRGIRTKIGSGSMKEVSPAKRGQYYRMKKWNSRLDESRDRRMKFALGELERLVAVLNLPESVLEETSRLYEKALDKGIIKGRNIENVVAALVYIIARNQSVPRTMSEIAKEAGISERKLGKAYRYVARELDLGIMPVNPGDFIPRFAGDLDVSGRTSARARQLIRDAREEDIASGRSPDSVAAAALYLASKLEGEEVTQKKVAETVDVTEVTVRKGYRNLMEGLDIEEDFE